MFKKKTKGKVPTIPNQRNVTRITRAYKLRWKNSAFVARSEKERERSLYRRLSLRLVTCRDLFIVGLWEMYIYIYIFLILVSRVCSEGNLVLRHSVLRLKQIINILYFIEIYICNMYKEIGNVYYPFTSA